MFSSLDLELVVWSCGYARIEATELLPEILAASVAVFSQDLSVSDQELSWGVEWVEAERSWDRTTVYTQTTPQALQSVLHESCP